MRIHGLAERLGQRAQQHQAHLPGMQPARGLACSHLPVTDKDDGPLAHPRGHQLLHQLRHRALEGQRLALQQSDGEGQAAVVPQPQHITCCRAKLGLAPGRHGGRS